MVRALERAQIINQMSCGMRLCPHLYGHLPCQDSGASLCPLSSQSLPIRGSLCRSVITVDQWSGGRSLWNHSLAL